MSINNSGSITLNYIKKKVCQRGEARKPSGKQNTTRIAVGHKGSDGNGNVTNYSGLGAYSLRHNLTISAQKTP